MPGCSTPIKPPITQDKSVINLSPTFIPRDRHHKLLQKGLSFIPTPPINNRRQSLMAHLSSYHRRLKLHSYFEGKRIKERIPFLSKSTWEPNSTDLPEILLTLFKKDHNTLRNIRPVPEKNNLSVAEEQALTELQCNTSIVIKPADKGSSVVIMDRFQYVGEALRQLRNTDHYTPLSTPIYMETASQIREILDSMTQNKTITKKQRRYLLGDDTPRKRVFYLLPKIHKAPDTWPIPFLMPPGRPIVSDCGSESYQIAEFLDYYLNPLSTLHDSYLKDTYDFINKIKSMTIQEPSLIFSMDVESLYTNIDTRMGLRAVKTIMDKYPDPSRPDQFILQLLDNSLTRNDFEFDKQHYLQVKGTAMGKRFAPAYANIYMATWEETILPKCTKLPTHYYRYLDDIWGIWTHGMDEFQEFVQTLNTHHPSINLKPLTSQTSMDFLDVTTFKGPDFNTTGKLDTRVFFKPTDSHALLHYSSFHPKHTFTGIIKSQLIRFQRICSRPEDCTLATQTLFRALKRRGYPRSLLRTVRKNFNNTRSPAQKDRFKNKHIVPFVATYSPYTTQAIRRAKKHFEDTMSGTSLAQNIEIIPAYKRNPNLRDMLVRAKLPLPSARPVSPGRCRTVTNPTTKNTYLTQRNITLKHCNCIYKIECGRCKKVYVGETRNSLSARLSTHKYNIRTGKKPNTFLEQHFAAHGLQNLKLYGLQHNPHWSTRERKGMEHFWIQKLDTWYPKGLNEN